jgi:hypothetical protein
MPPPMRRAACFFLSMFLVAVAASAADMKLEARLVRGANDEKDGLNCKPMNAELAAKLQGTFKWKYYFEITNQCASIPINKSRDLKMSEQYTLRIKNLGGSRVEISCMGDGKQRCKGAYTLTPPKWLVLGGNSENDTAWFIGLRSDTKAGAANKVISKN